MIKPYQSQSWNRIEADAIQRQTKFSFPLLKIDKALPPSPSIQIFFLSKARVKIKSFCYPSVLSLPHITSPALFWSRDDSQSNEITLWYFPFAKPKHTRKYTAEASHVTIARTKRHVTSPFDEKHAIQNENHVKKIVVSLLSSFFYFAHSLMMCLAYFMTVVERRLIFGRLAELATSGDEQTLRAWRVSMQLYA